MKYLEMLREKAKHLKPMKYPEALNKEWSGAKLPVPKKLKYIPRISYIFDRDMYEDYHNFAVNWFGTSDKGEYSFWLTFLFGKKSYAFNIYWYK